MPLNIFLVEDDPVIRETIVSVLTCVPGARVVSSEAEAAKASIWLRAHKDEWDVTVLDLFLSQGTGFDVLETIESRKDRARVIVLTNSPSVANRELCKKLGAYAMFDKTLEIEQFLDCCKFLGKSAIHAKFDPLH